MSVELIETMGDDLSIVNAARVSYAKTSTELSDADYGLIGYLARNRHGTPFEMVQFKFRVHVPIGVAREWQRHRIGSFNEMSTRYVEMVPEFYVPPVSAVRTQVGKPGHYEMVAVEHDDAVDVQRVMREAYAQAYTTYASLIATGIAKELARNVLPLGLYTEFIWSVNLRSVFNFLSLRTHETALLEIRREAYNVEGDVKRIVPVAWNAWNENGRVSL